ncbi:MAG: hypothetical protein NTAFB01_05560 [Nitrospira sp.]
MTGVTTGTVSTESSFDMPFDDRVITYTGSYLQQEIVAEGATRNIAAFSRFLKALAEERKLKRYPCISLEALQRQVGEVTILPTHEFLRNLWDGAYA